MSHPGTLIALARPRRSIAAALAFVLVSLLVFAAPIGEAAKDPSITITADHQTVKAGDQVTLKIKLQNVKNATLNGEALAGGKNNVEKKVLVCATTTYTVAAMPTDGGPKISQALTITASGTATNAACLPDLAVTALGLSQRYDPVYPNWEIVCVNYSIESRGQLPIASGDVVFYVNGKPSEFKWTPTSKALTFCEGWQDGQVVRYSLMVDPDNKIVESDEMNNVKTASITVVVGQNPPGTVQKFDKLNTPHIVIKP